MAFEEDPVMRRLAMESAAARMREEAAREADALTWPEDEWPEDVRSTEPGIPAPVEKALKVGIALEVIHLLTGWRPPGPFGH
jgi:hypothetical protein